MKGLILKELYLIKSFAKQYVLITLMMAGVSVLTNNISFVASYIIVLSSSMVMSTTAMDEAVAFNRYAVTMPIDSGKLVQSKYAILFISILGGGGFIWLLTALVNAFPSLSGKREVMDIEGVLVIISLFVAANAIAIPVMFKVGATKARYTYIIVMLVMGAAIFGAYHLSRISGNSLDDMLAGMGGMLNLAAAGFAAVVVLISYLISVKIVQKKEW